MSDNSENWSRNCKRPLRAAVGIAAAFAGTLTAAISQFPRMIEAEIQPLIMEFGDVEKSQDAGSGTDHAAGSDADSTSSSSVSQQATSSAESEAAPTERAYGEPIRRSKPGGGLVLEWPRRHRATREQAKENSPEAEARALLEEAQEHFDRGDVLRALRLARRAWSYPVDWPSGEPHPVALLDRIRELARDEGFVESVNQSVVAGIVPDDPESEETTEASEERQPGNAGPVWESHPTEVELGARRVVEFGREPDSRIGVWNALDRETGGSDEVPGYARLADDALSGSMPPRLTDMEKDGQADAADEAVPALSSSWSAASPSGPSELSVASRHSPGDGSNRDEVRTADGEIGHSPEHGQPSVQSVEHLRAQSATETGSDTDTESEPAAPSRLEPEATAGRPMAPETAAYATGPAVVPQQAPAQPLVITTRPEASSGSPVETISTNVLGTLITIFAVLFFGSLFLLLLLIAVGKKLLGENGISLRVELVNSSLSLKSSAADETSEGKSEPAAAETETETRTARSVQLDPDFEGILPLSEQRARERESAILEQFVNNNVELQRELASRSRAA